MIKIAINGAAGRMGRRIAALAIESEQFDIVSAMEMAGSDAIGRDLGELAGVGTFGVEVTETMADGANVVIDFSLPEGTLSLLEICRKRGIAMIIGTTGL
ncbi:MAG: 4-hydroxy-tetrahydrodipicolinate reductase, partial [Phycisphaerae bacterium]|nr:4-hydroxy-tetrahydrodipicolinate reductase [Phycisphaerae bacterium]